VPNARSQGQKVSRGDKFGEKHRKGGSATIMAGRWGCAQLHEGAARVTTESALGIARLKGAQTGTKGRERLWSWKYPRRGAGGPDGMENVSGALTKQTLMKWMALVSDRGKSRSRKQLEKRSTILGTGLGGMTVGGDSRSVD